jgi:hypothetical protein
MLTNCEKDPEAALEAFRERALAESQFCDMKNGPAMSGVPTHGPSAMRGRTFVQFLTLIFIARIRGVIASAWENRKDMPEEDKLSRRCSLEELMMVLGTCRETRFSNLCGAVVSAPAKAQRSIFRALAIKAG